jgi:hypothetical protein
MEVFKKLDRRIIMLLMLIIIVIPAIYPLGIPVIVSGYTKEAYNYIENLPPGSTVVIGGGIGVSLWPDLESYARALFWQLAQLPVKTVIVGFSADDVLLMQSVIDYVDLQKNFPDKKYGVDIVLMGYLAGVENAYAKFAKDPYNAFTTDYYGTPISQLPIMQGLKQTSDISVIILFTGADATAPVRQFVTTYKIPLIAAPNIGWVPTYMPYYQAGQLVGLIAGIRGGAEYELLIGKPGKGLAITDGLSLSFLYTLILIVAGNIYYFNRRDGGKKVNKI